MDPVRILAGDLKNLKIVFSSFYAKHRDLLVRDSEESGKVTVKKCCTYMAHLFVVASVINLRSLVFFAYRQHIEREKYTI